MKDEKDAQQDVAAWLHEDGSRSITAAEKRSMLENQGVPGKRVAALYNVPLGRLANQRTLAAAAPVVPLPPTPLPVLRHPQLGELFDGSSLLVRPDIPPGPRCRIAPHPPRQSPMAAAQAGAA